VIIWRRYRLCPINGGTSPAHLPSLIHYGGDRHVAMMASAGARLLKAFAAQVETMRRLRNGGTQVIRVERIEVSEPAQAIIGNV
jgi:hypothetical protein